MKKIGKLISRNFYRTIYIETCKSTNFFSDKLYIKTAPDKTAEYFNRNGETMYTIFNRLSTDLFKLFMALYLYSSIDPVFDPVRWSGQNHSTWINSIKCMDHVLCNGAISISWNRIPDGEKKVDCDYAGVPDYHLTKAQVLFTTVASVIGRSSRFTVDTNANFYELGGNSLNSIYTVTKLREQGFEIGITDFLKAKNMKEILEKMRSTSDSKDVSNDQEKSKFVVEMLDHSHRAEVTQ